MLGMFRLGKAGGAGLVQEWQAGERFGWRVMVRLGAVLCGTVMYGLAWLARLGEARSVTAV